MDSAPFATADAVVPEVDGAAEHPIDLSAADVERPDRAEQPVIAPVTVDEPGDDQPGDDQPGDDQPGDDQPGDDQSSVDETSSVDEPTTDELADSGRAAARLARRDAKALARQKRGEAREKLAAAKAQARAESLATTAAARVDSATADQVSREVLELTPDHPSSPIVVEDQMTSEVEPVEPAAADSQVIAREVREKEEAAQSSQQAEAEKAAAEKAAAQKAAAEKVAAEKVAAEKVAAEKADAERAKLAAKASRRDSKDAAARHRAEARVVAQQSKASARDAKKSDQKPASDQKQKDDHIVEPPREPKLSLAAKVRAARSKRTPVAASSVAVAGAAPGRAGAPASGGGRSGRRRLISVLAGIVGAVGLICSVVLAFGALLVALDADGGSVFDAVSGVCDVLVGPLRDVFSFSGSNAAMKESLVAWGAGSIIYLVVGVMAQSLLRSGLDD